MVRLRHAPESSALAFRASRLFARVLIIAFLIGSLASPVALGAPSADNASAVTKTVLVPAGVPVRAPLVSTEAVSGDTVSMILTVTSSISGQIAVTADVGGRTPEFSAQAPPGGTIRVNSARTPDVVQGIPAGVWLFDSDHQRRVACDTVVGAQGEIRVPGACQAPATEVFVLVDYPPIIQAPPGALPSTGAGGMGLSARSAPRCHLVRRRPRCRPRCRRGPPRYRRDDPPPAQRGLTPAADESLCRHWI